MLILNLISFITHGRYQHWHSKPPTVIPPGAACHYLSRQPEGRRAEPGVRRCQVLYLPGGAVRAYGSAAVAQDNPFQRKEGALQHHLCGGEPHHDICPDTALHFITYLRQKKLT